MDRSAIPDTLETDDERIRSLAGGAATLTLDAVEQAFQKLPAGREAAAVIVILRELMHHLQIGTIRLVAQ